MNMVESLESRRLLSVSLQNGTLLITGNNKNNTVDVSYSQFLGKVVVTDTILGQLPMIKQFGKNQIKKIKITGGGGDDILNVLNMGKVPIYFDGGAGNDIFNTISSTMGKCTLIGGAGDDQLTGGSAGDVIDGGAGADRLFGNAGKDTLTGGTGIDLIEGGIGDDTIFAKDGAQDTVKGMDGLDKGRVNPVENALHSDALEKVL
jgi:Ca2+-binding RTX toxin-like protein